MSDLQYYVIRHPTLSASPMSKAVVFLDTNIFLHFQPFDQVKWTEVLDANADTGLVGVFSTVVAIARVCCYFS